MTMITIGKQQEIYLPVISGLVGAWMPSPATIGSDDENKVIINQQMLQQMPNAPQFPPQHTVTAPATLQIEEVDPTTAEELIDMPTLQQEEAQQLPDAIMNHESFH